MSAPIRVVLADDERLIRDALATLLSLETDIEVVGQAASGTECLALLTRLKPDVAVMDLHMPGHNGIEVAAAAIAAEPNLGVIIVTSNGRPGHLKRALVKGVRGFLPKTTSAAALADAIRKVADGGRYVDPELAVEAIASGDSPLNGREADLLILAEQGAPIEEIASRSHLAAGTVRNYLSSAAAKLGAANRHEAARIARQHGWL